MDPVRENMWVKHLGESEKKVIEKSELVKPVMFFRVIHMSTHYTRDTHDTPSLEFTTYIVMTEWEPRLTVILHERNNPSFKATPEPVKMTSHQEAELKKAEKAKYMREIYRPRVQVRSKRQTALAADILAREEAAGVERVLHMPSKFDDAGSKNKLRRATERHIIQSADPDLLQESHIAATEWITRKKKVHS